MFVSGTRYNKEKLYDNERSLDEFQASLGTIGSNSFHSLYGLMNKLQPSYGNIDHTSVTAVNRAFLGILYLLRKNFRIIQKAPGPDGASPNRLFLTFHEIHNHQK